MSEAGASEINFIGAGMKAFRLKGPLPATLVEGRRPGERIAVFHGLPKGDMGGFKAGDRGMVVVHDNPPRAEGPLCYRRSEIRDITETSRGLTFAFYIDAENYGPFEADTITMETSPPGERPVIRRATKTRYLRASRGQHPTLGVFWPGPHDKQFRPGTVWTVTVEKARDPFFNGGDARFPCTLTGVEDWQPGAFWIDFRLILDGG